MKKILKNILKVFVVLLFVGGSFTVSAQPPPPPAGSGNDSTNKLGGNAPIGGGLFILLGLGAAYGGRKVYNLRKELNEDSNQ